MRTHENLVVLRSVRLEQGDRTILRDVDLAAPPGSVTVVTGQNGSGKSTLLAALAGVHPLADGWLQLGAGVRRAFVPQRSEATDVLPLTIADVVGMGRWFGRRIERRSLVASSLAAVGLTGMEKRPLGELSGGQRQRVLLAQGLAQRADLLLLDEPATGLDDAGTRLVEEAVAAEAARGAAVVLVTHDRAFVEGAQRLVRLENGICRRRTAGRGDL